MEEASIQCSTEYKDDPPAETKPTSSFLKRNLLVILTIIAILMGFGSGMLLRTLNPSDITLLWIGLPGELFLNLLKMMIIPLIVSSVISATGSMDPVKNGRIGVILMAYSVATNVLSAFTGIVMGVIVQPGAGVEFADTEAVDAVNTGLQPSDIFADLLRNVMPDNIVRAMIQKKKTVYSMSEMTRLVNTTGGLVNVTSLELIRGQGWGDSVNILGLIFACLLLGLACGHLKEQGEPFLAFFNSTLQIMLVLLRWVVWTAPFGIFSLITVSIAEIHDVSSIFAKLGMLSVAVIGCVVIHQVVIMPGVYFITCRKNPLPVYVKGTKSWLVSFSSTSVACAMPYMFEACAKLNIDRKLYTFGLPTALTFNADGSAAYICVACQFMAIINGISLDVSQLVIICVLASVFAMAVPPVPSASLVLVVIICTTLNIPTESIALLVAVEWLLDRMRTTSNMITVMFAVIITDHFCKSDL